MNKEQRTKKKKVTGNKRQVTRNKKNGKKNILRPNDRRERVEKFSTRSPIKGLSIAWGRARSNNNETKSWEQQKKKWYLAIGAMVLGVFLFNAILIATVLHVKKSESPAAQPKQAYWFMLHRKSQKEFFYRGVPGDAKQSKLVKTFIVKTGIPGERPTPLPQLVGREYWLIVDKMDSSDNPETAPYFLKLDIPAPSDAPYGPAPYKECGGEQCDWQLPGEFGLHGIASNAAKLTDEDLGSSGCVRHRDEDITYLYHLLDPKKEEIRYYIEEI